MAGEVKLKTHKLEGISFEIATIEYCRRREASVKEAFFVLICSQINI